MSVLPQLPAARRRSLALPTATDASYDRITALLADAFAVPGAILELIEDGKPVVRSYLGQLPVGLVQEVLRVESGLKHDGVLIVPDARYDARFNKMAVVQADLGIRFLAIAPLRTPDGELLGTLAAFAPGPRRVLPVEARMLTTLAGLVMDGISLRAAFSRTEDEVNRQRQLEALLASSRNRYRSVIDSLSEVIFQIGLDGRWRFLNRAWTTLTGQDFKAALGQRALLSVMPEDRRPLLELLDPLREGALQSASLDLRYRNSAGEIRWFKLYGFLAHDDEAGESALITGTLTDVTDQRATEVALREAREAAEQANATRAAFLATVSHEIRTPINGVIGMTGLLLDTNLTAEQWRYANTLRVSAEHLLHVINDILDYSKIDADKMEYEEVRVEPQEIIDSVLAITSPRAGAKGIELRAVMPPNLPDDLVGDPGRLRQILVNLVGNAVKFTERGHVTITVGITDEDATKATLVVAVADTGIGIPASARNALFKEFSQVDSSVARRFGGTGLGLAICKRLLDGMGGQIEVESEVGKGSVFRFAVPLHRDASLAREAAANTDTPDAQGFAGGGRVLVAEDNATNQLIVVAMLEKMGLRVDVVANGAEAVQAVRSIPYNVVLMDMQMPEMDGLEATRQIRRLAPPLGAIPIIGVTANAFREDHDRCREAGMQEVVTKPFRWADLMRALTPYLPSPRAAAGEQMLADLSVGTQEAFDKLISEVGAEAAQAITQVFMRDSRARLERMIGHAERRDIKAVGREAHALKGSADMLGFERLTALAATLEAAGRKDALPPDFAELMTALKHEAAAVEELCRDRVNRKLPTSP